MTCVLVVYLVALDSVTAAEDLNGPTWLLCDGDASRNTNG